MTETDVVFAVPGGLPHAVKEDALQLGPYRVSRGHFLLGDFQESLSASILQLKLIYKIGLNSVINSKSPYLTE